MLKNKARLSLFLFAITSGLSAGAFWFIRDEADGGVDFFSRKSYYIILMMFMGWVVSCYQLVKAERFSLWGWIKENKVAAWTSLALVLIARFSVPMEFKTLSDETNLLSVSQSMVNDRTVFNTTLAKNFYGNLNPVFVSVPTRPLMHPFFLHIMHQLFGYHYQNGFYLNLLVYGLILLGVYWMGRKLGGHWVGIASQVFVASYGIFPISATSGGYDLLSILFLITVFGGLRGVLLSATPERFLFLFFSAFVFFNIRYESILFLPILAAVIIASEKWTRELTEKSAWCFSLVPIFLLPFLIQRVLTPDPYEAPAGVEPFSLEHLWNHFFALLTDHLKPFHSDLPYALAVNWLIPIILITAVVAAIRGKTKEFSKDQKLWLGALSFGFLATFCLFLSHHLGIFHHPTQARFFLLFSMLGALCPAFLVYFFPGRVKAGPVLAFSVAAFLIYHPVAVENRFLNTLVLNRETQHNMAFLETLPNQNILFVSDRPGQYSSLGYGAVDFDYFNRYKEGFLNELSRKLFQNIYLSEKINYEDLSRHFVQLDPTKYRLETVRENQVDGNILQRISRIVALEPPKAP